MFSTIQGVDVVFYKHCFSIDYVNNCMEDRFFIVYCGYLIKSRRDVMLVAMGFNPW